jgi:SNF2 family DNA or RNA helicase
MSPDDQPKFHPGYQVRKRSTPDQAGIVLDAHYSEQREAWQYRIQFGNAQRAVVESDLEAVVVADPWRDLGQGVLAGLDAFKAAYTYHRLRRPPSRVAASFGTARTMFFPYQFKPLLKLLDHPQRRVLVADDVGLGKTIEAGYILRELDAHEHLDRILVVCPARLAQKWKADLFDKFQEHFEIVSSRRLMELQSAVVQGQELPDFRWITSYEAARRKGFIRFMNENPPQLDLAIFDEAHRVRNPDTLQHRLARAVCNASQAVVFLTATPVQTRQEDLFHLLSLLDPETYQSSYDFLQQMEANRHVVQALSCLRRSPPDGTAAVGELNRLGDYRATAHLAQSDVVLGLIKRVATAATLDRAELVGLQRDLSEFSFTSNILSRTRRVDVKENRPQRRVQAVTVAMSPEEQEFYDDVEDLCARIGMDVGDWGQSLAMIMAYRMVASCLPAAVGYFRDRLADPSIGAELATSLEDELVEIVGDDHDVEEIELAPDAFDRAAIAKLVRGVDLRHIDSKYDAFISALRGIWKDDRDAQQPKRKAIVFSFFKRTLAHLQACLTEEGVVSVLISGDVPIVERQFRIDRFRDDASIDILLASEVGSEGIDLQFASVVVNYDLPWNPMVVEQRIGRVDRIGQMCQTINVINLCLAGTVEDRILLRLYERVKLFEGMVGDIEPIVGEQVFKLTTQALVANLSEAEMERQLDQTANALINQVVHAEQLNSSVDAMLATDQAFLDEVEATVGRRRLPGPSEMREFISVALSTRFHGCDLPERMVRDIARVRLGSEVATELRRISGDAREHERVARLVEREDLNATFAADKVLGGRRAELIHARHPLVVLAQDIFAKNPAATNVPFGIQAPVPSPEQMPSAGQAVAGYYLLSLSLLEFSGVNRRNDLCVIGVRLGKHGAEHVSGESGRELLLYLLDHGTDLDFLPEGIRARMTETAEQLREFEFAEYDRLYGQEKRLNGIRVQRKLATLKASLDRQVEVAQEALNRARAKTAERFYVRMCEAKLAKALRRREQGASASAIQGDIGMDPEFLAVVLARLGGGEQ